MPQIYQNNHIKIEIEASQIPWLKIFTQKRYKEFSEAPDEVKLEILRALDIIEKEMLEFFKPAKINIASFGNYVPQRRSIDLKGLRSLLYYLKKSFNIF